MHRRLIRKLVAEIRRLREEVAAYEREVHELKRAIDDYLDVYQKELWRLRMRCVDARLDARQKARRGRK